jgi:hypothetical protein
VMELDTHDVTELRRSFEGPVIVRSDADYD